MDVRQLDLDTYLVFSRPAASTGFWYDLKLKCSSEEKMETEPGLKAINKIHSQEGSQWSALLHPLPRQAAAEHHRWQEKYTETHFTIYAPLIVQTGFSSSHPFDGRAQFSSLQGRCSI